ncbi:MAG: S26 family signal peptidase [Halanaeroarchaeum sp.]
MTEDPSDRDESSAGSDGAETVRRSTSTASEPEDRPTDPRGRGDDTPDPREGPVAAARWFLRTDTGPVVFVREVLASALAVVAVGLLLFAVSGVWPPMVAVESGSMEPHLQRGDLVFIMEEHRLSPAYATGHTGVVTYQTGVRRDYRSFGSYGDVIVYRPYGDTDRTPVIHRARFWVNDSENWLSKANPAYLPGDTCSAVPNCPAPHAGFITKGDNQATNEYYDQVRGISDPVKPSWIVGTAEVRIPYLGWVRLTFSEMRSPSYVGGPVPLPW